MSKSIENDVSRKEFLRKAGSTALFAALGIGLMSCSNTTGSDEDNLYNNPNNGGGDEESPISITNNGNTITIDLSDGSVSKLKNSGEWLLISEATTLVVNVDGEVIRAFTSVCTHQGCTTNWEYANRTFECTCHGSKFDNSGAVINGPADRDLDEFSVTLDGDELIINKN